MYKQIIIARKDLCMSPGKLAAQVSHASMAFLTAPMRDNYKEVLDCNCGFVYDHRIDSMNKIRREHGLEPIERKRVNYRRGDLNRFSLTAENNGKEIFYYKKNQCGDFIMCDKEYHIEAVTSFDPDVFNQWILGEFTKCILCAKNRSKLLKAVTIAESMGMQENSDYFLIKDNCRTELEPEEYDDTGQGRTLTCIGFRPMEDSVIDQIGKKYQLYN